MGKTIGLTGALETYYVAHACREPAILAELRAETATLGGDAAMQIGPEQGAFMRLIVKLMGARRVIEFGTFTGYSSLSLALAGATRIERFTGAERQGEAIGYDPFSRAYYTISEDLNPPVYRTDCSE